MHKYHKIAAETIPEGYSRVRSGRILPDDLVYSIYTKEFLRHDDPSWHHRCDWINQAAFVVRASDKKKPETDNGPEQLLIYAPQQTEFGF